MSRALTRPLQKAQRTGHPKSSFPKSILTMSNSHHVKFLITVPMLDSA